MDIPEAMIKTQQEQMIDEFAQRMSMQGLSMEQYYQFTGATYDKLFESVRPQAEERIKARLVLEAIAKAENIEATDDDFKAEMETIAKAYGMNVDDVEKAIGSTSAYLKESIVARKTVEHLAEKAVKVAPKAEEKTEEA